jgi:hypothetical protein
MKNFLIFFLSLFLIVSCQKDVNEDNFDLEIDSRNVNLNSDATSAGDIIRDHFHNNKASDPLLLLPEEYREEFNTRLNYLTDNYSDDLEFSSVLEKLRNEYGMTEAVSIELQLFHDGLIAALEEDAHSVHNYYNIELQKNRNLSTLDSYLVSNIIEASQALWDVTCIHLGIANEFQIMTREDREPLCDPLIDDLRTQLIHINAGVGSGAYLGGLIGGILGGPVGAGVGTIIGAVGGGILGWFSSDATLDRLYAACERCLPPTSLSVTTSDCSLTADFTPVGAGISVTSLLWESEQTIPMSATGSRTQTQTFSQIPSSGPIEFRITSTCMFDGNPITLFRDLSGGNIEGQLLDVPYNAFYVTGNDALKIPITNGIVGAAVTETYQYSGLALDNSGDYSFEFLGSVVNGTVVSTSSNSITIRWFPANINDYILNKFAWGSFRFRVTNNCPGGESKIFTFTALINGDENEV